MVEKLLRTNKWKTARENPQNLVHMEEPASTQRAAPTPAQQNTRCGGWNDPQLTSHREEPTKERPQNNQTQIHKESQHKWQPKTSELGRLRRLHHWISQIFYHRSSHHKSKESEQINLKAEANKKNITNNGKTKKQSSNEKKGGSLRNNAEWKRGK